MVMEELKQVRWEPLEADESHVEENYWHHVADLQIRKPSKA